MNDKIKNAQEEIIKTINNALSKLVKLLETARTDNGYPWIVFSLDDTEYAINARYVLRVTAINEIVPFSGAPAYCPGLYGIATV